MILMIYQKDAFKEYLLPNVNNIDDSVLLDKEIFHTRNNIRLLLEITNHQWTIKEGKEYVIFSDGQIWKEKKLSQNEIIHIKTQDGVLFDILAAKEEASFPVFEKYDISNKVEITIGSDSGNMISYQFQKLVSQEHCRIRKSNGSFYVEDISSNGIFMNGRRITKQQLKFGDVIHVFGLNLVFLNDALGVAAHYGNAAVNASYLKKIMPRQIIETPAKKPAVSAEATYNRPLRYLPPIHQGSVEIEAPPELKLTKQKPLIAVIGPSFTMAIPMVLGSGLAVFGGRMSGGASLMMMLSGIVMAIASAVLGVIWALFNIKLEAKEDSEQEQARFNAYGNYLIEMADSLKQKYEQNANALREMYPSSRECCQFHRNSNRLWNRNMSHEDFLFTRLGLGNIPFQVQIEIPKERFAVSQDSLREKPAIIKADYQMLENVPVGIDLKQQLWGIVGGKDFAGTMDIVYHLVAQTAANHCYTDVKMVFIYDEEKYSDKCGWDFIKWFPHVWSEDKTTRYIAGNALEAGDIFYELTNILRKRENEAKLDSQNVMPKPYYLLFVSDASLLEGELIAQYVYEPKPVYGMTTVILADYAYELPNACEHVIQNDNNFSGFYHTMGQTEERHSVLFEKLLADDVKALSHTLAGMEVSELESSGNIPSSLDFFEMFGVNSLEGLGVLDRWRKSRTYNTMGVLIGKKMGGADAVLDIHEKYHGPHGLIAGTTGSGKSELLQTYILSLAVNFSPDDVGFFVIDFKGGGMANLFLNLPHMVGQISNLSGNQVRRAMISIKSENMRRQRMFNKYGVNNINLYTRLYKDGEASEPIPHLFIVIDEFAELKREEPEFMQELISVAQVGRSLGVHLILATQKPSGTVDDNIWSNSKFRLCLRVQDRADSNDMLHKPDAAYLTQAGRCYLQVGNDEIYELFQSGYSGAAYEEEAFDTKAEIAQMLTRTGKTAIVGSRIKMKFKEEKQILWYQQILNAIESVRIKNGWHTSILSMDEEQQKEIVKAVIVQLNISGANYDNSTSNEKKMYDFLLFYANGNTTAESILKRAAETGKKLPEMSEKTQLDAVIEYLAKLAEENGYRQTGQLWLPVLPRQILLEDIKGSRFSGGWGSGWKEMDSRFQLEVTVGLYDDPENQSQLPASVSLSENGHYAVIGSVVSGKSTFLQTFLYAMIQKYSPDAVHFYVLDFSSHMLEAFGEAPHVGGVLFENDTEAIGRFFQMARRIMQERAKLFGGGNYSQYMRAYGTLVPAIVIVIDDYANFREKTEERYDEDILQISAKGVSLGIFLVVSGAGFGMSEIPARVGDNMKGIVSLQVMDRFKCMDILRSSQIAVLPEEGIAGRGLMNIGGSVLEFQTALCVKAEDAFERTTNVLKICRMMKENWKKQAAPKIPSIPEKPVMQLLEENQEYQEAILKPSLLPVGYRYSDASIYSVHLDRIYCYFISGKKHTGKTTYLRVLMKSVYKKGGKIFVIEKKNQKLAFAAEQYHATYIGSDKEQFSFFKSLFRVFAERNKYKQELVQQGKDEGEIYEQMQKFPPAFIFLADLKEFLKSAYEPPEDIGTMSGTLENIWEKGMYHNIYFFACLNMEDMIDLSMYPAYKHFTSYKMGVHLGGNVASQTIFDFQNIRYQEASKSMAKGIGLTPSLDDETEAERIVFPEIGRDG